MLKEIQLELGQNDIEISDYARALSSIQRLQILELLNASSMSVKELAEKLNAPLSSTLLNVNILAECNLITIKEMFTDIGKYKLCCRNCDYISLKLYQEQSNINSMFRVEIPIGNYSEYDIPYGTGCGIATKNHTIGNDNDADVFFSPERFNAGYIWFEKGFLKYKTANKSIPGKLRKISISFEVCSEAPFYRNDWKSDITMILCGVEVGSWTSQGDYGGRRGINNPRWWSDTLTQFGILTTWEITSEGTFVNNVKISDVTIKDIDIKKEPYITMEIGVKEDAKYCGGMSLFGESFGDYKQDIIFEFYWD